MKQQRTLGVDPGTKNYALVGLNTAGRAVFARMLTNTIWSLSMQHKHLRKKFRIELKSVFKEFRPTEVIYEQFVVRSFGTTLTQMVNTMNGAFGVYADIYKFNEDTITSTTWKNQIKKIGDLQDLYDIAKAMIVVKRNGRKGPRGVPPHLVDALCMAHWKRNGGKFLDSDRRAIYRNLQRIRNILRDQHAQMSS